MLVGPRMEQYILQMDESPFVTEFYDVNGIQITAERDADKFQTHTEFYQRSAAKQRAEAAETIRDYGRDMPAWLEACRREAYAFIGTLGLSSTATMHLIDHESLSAGGKPSAFGESFPFHNTIYLYNRQIQRLYESAHGSPAVTRIIIHELVHSATNWTTRCVLREGAKPRGSYMAYRSGFEVHKRGRPLGAFFEEASAEYLAGLYDPSGEQARLEPQSHDLPSLEIPMRYQHFTKVSGPDGYAFELIGWALARRGEITQDDFTTLLVATTLPETRVAALRLFPRLLNSLEPGLYRTLQAVPYSTRAFRAAYKRVYTLTTGSQRLRAGSGVVGLLTDQNRL
ncbi:MAG: hypothetical protein JWN38_1271 [Candidatus Saccharibacteria bacterium]|nr:hypothetical protein [Candidatus Saccharibacteria bacterium]